MKGRIDLFIDTNILFYAYDRQAGKKHLKAIELIEACWTQEKIPSLSTQVLNELAYNLLRKKQPFQLVKDIISSYLKWNIVIHQEQDTCLALGLKERWQLSFWDAMIILAAKKSSATILWSEDLNHKQNYDGVMVINPFEASR